MSNAEETIGGMARPAAAPPGGAATRADVNGDGIADVVVSTGARLTYAGDPNTLGVDRGGSVYVIPGGGTLPAAGDDVISQDSHDFIPGSGEDTGKCWCVSSLRRNPASAAVGEFREGASGLVSGQVRGIFRDA